MIDSPEKSATTLQGEQLLSALLTVCREEGYSLACWKRPGNMSFQGIIDFERPELPEDRSLQGMPPGFLLAPYDWNMSPLLIKSQVYFTSDGDLCSQVLTDDALETFQNKLEQIPGTIKEPVEKIAEIDHTGWHEDFTMLVKRAVEQIKLGQFQKVVPARTKTLNLSAASLPGHFLRLVMTYPQAFVNLTYTPETNVWMGATPELLVSLRENRYFETIALAGTQPYDGKILISDVAWTQKEIEEQALVGRYIINCFKKIRLREYEEIGPKTVIAGNLIHLKTRYCVDMEAVNFPQLGTVMLDLLHPTSAVCGMPREKAAEWLRSEESFDREFFSGYIGPVNMDGLTTLYVNLRCLKYNQGKATFFAGAGVTEDSIPEKEWIETEIKMNTLLNCIRGDQTAL